MLTALFSDTSLTDNAVSYEDAQQEVLMNQAEGNF